MPRSFVVWSVLATLFALAVPTRAEEPKTAPKSDPKSDPEPEEVTVSGTRDPIAPQAKSLGRAEIRSLPGAFGDPFRAIDALPGVVPLFSGLPYYYIRGAPPSNVGYFVDGVRVPYLFHFGLGPGVVPPQIIERVDLHAGAMPAAWGRYAGAVVSGITAAPRDRLWGEATVRLVDAGGILETPFADGKGHVLASGRYSYSGALLSLLAPDILLNYGDYTARVTYDLSPRDRLTLFSLGAYDIAGQTEDGERKILFASEYHRVDARWDRKWSERTTSRLAMTLGYDRSRLEGLRFVRDASLGARGNVKHVLGPSVTVRAGFDANVHRYSGDPVNQYSVRRSEYEESVAFFSSRFDSESGVYADAVLTLPGGVQMIPGVRVDLFTSKGNHEIGLDPRIASILPLHKRLRLVLAEGIAHQGYAFAVPIPAFSYPGLPGGLQTAYQSSATFEAELPHRFTATLGGFHHEYRNMHDLFALGGDDGSAFDAPRTMSGQATGLELSLRRPLTERLGGVISYTLSRNTRNLGVRDIVNGFDRTHVLNVALSANVGKGFRVGSRVLFYTGVPRLERTLAEARGVPASADVDGRLPAFVRLDVRAEKRWSTAQGWFSIVLEGLNVTLSKESLGYDCRDGVCRPDEFGPISIPSLAFEGGF